MTTYKIRRGREMRPKMKRLRGASAIGPAVASAAVGAVDALAPPAFGAPGRSLIRCETPRITSRMVVWSVVGLSLWVIGALTGTGLLTL